MLKKYMDKIMGATTEEEVMQVIYGPDGVDRSFQKEKLSWADHERLFRLAEIMLQNIANNQY